ncbi:protein rolling stone-like [Branchiostoma floridae]|uniref:Protein rolling stone-like n=1 Tax=Branchiostoma floridae TaxID=7739 RepID=A0A9J7LY01_BRAFL|nr:protein rolling stone-like [Branchiostoma floridae]
MWLLAKYAATENYFFYATYYGFYILTAYFLWSAVVTCVGLFRARSSVQPTDTDRDQETAHQSNAEQGNVTTQNNLRWFHQVQWLLMNMAFSPAIIITIGFTGFLSDGQYNFKDLTTHILNTALVFVDVLVCGVPVRVLHAVYPVMFGFAYIVLYAVSWAATGTVVYWFLDFSKPALSSAAVLGFVLVALPLFHLLFYGLYLLRCRLLMWLSGGKTPATGTNPARAAPV